MISRLTANHAESLFLEVRVSNTRAIALYHSVGFQEISRRKGYYPTRDGREDAIVMQKLSLSKMSTFTTETAKLWMAMDIGAALDWAR